MHSLNAKRRMTDSRSREEFTRTWIFNDLNIHLYLRLNYGTAAEHFKYSAAQNSVRTTSDLDRSRLTDTRSAENDQIETDTDPEYRIDASLVFINTHTHACIYLRKIVWLYIKYIYI